MMKVLGWVVRLFKAAVIVEQKGVALLDKVEELRFQASLVHDEAQQHVQGLTAALASIGHEIAKAEDAIATVKKFQA